MQDIVTKISEFDQPIFYFINQTIKTRLLDLFFPLITRLAEPTVVISLCIILFLFGRYKAKFTSVFILLTLFISYLITNAIKDVINRPRPLDIYSDISVMGTVKFSSFPSMHSVVIAVIVTTLCFKYKKWSFILLPIALLVGISRIYLGHHFPSDVVAGFMIGCIIAILFWGIEGLAKDIQSL